MPPDLDELRNHISQLLKSGLKTQKSPLIKDHLEFAELLRELRQIDRDHLEERLCKAGFHPRPYGPEQQRCFECMYYLVHRKWCDLPEVSLPVEPSWWCRLWRL